MHSVVETEVFARSCRRAGLGDDEKSEIIEALAADPTAGDLIVGTGGARKLRFPAPGRGKRGGYRVVTYYCAEDVPVFLMDIFVKGERVDLSQAERNELKKILRTVADDYRGSVRKLAKKRAE